MRAAAGVGRVNMDGVDWGIGTYVDHVSEAFTAWGARPTDDHVNDLLARSVDYGSSGSKILEPEMFMPTDGGWKTKW